MPNCEFYPQLAILSVSSLLTKHIMLVAQLHCYLVDTDKVWVVELPHHCDLHQHQLLAGLLAQVHLLITDMTSHDIT